VFKSPLDEVLLELPLHLLELVVGDIDNLNDLLLLGVDGAGDSFLQSTGLLGLIRFGDASGDASLGEPLLLLQMVRFYSLLNNCLHMRFELNSGCH